jgi:hypothetical protein
MNSGLMNSFDSCKCAEELQTIQWQLFSNNTITRCLLIFFSLICFRVTKCAKKRHTIQFLLRLVVRDDDRRLFVLDLAVKCAEFMRVMFLVLIERILKESQSFQIINAWSTRDDFRFDEQFWLYKCLEASLTRMPWTLTSNNKAA